MTHFNKLVITMTKTNSSWANILFFDGCLIILMQHHWKSKCHFSIHMKYAKYIIRRFRNIAKIFSLSFRPSVCLSLCLSVRPPARMEHLGSHWIDFHKIWCLSVFRKSVKKTELYLKSDNNNGTLHKDLCTFMIISRWILLRKRNTS